MKNTDLHTHSHYSDGQISPKELVRLAKKRKIKNLALTDHNSVKGVEEAIKEGRRIGINIIPAVEMGTENGEILGYFIDTKNKELIRKIKQNCKKIEEIVKDWCKKLRKAGYKLSFKMLEKKYSKAKGNIGILHVLYEIYLQGHGTTREIAAKLWGDRKLRPKKERLMKATEAIRIIKRAGGVPVLAHPWLDKKRKDIKNIKQLIKSGLKGIEENNGDRPPLRDKKLIKKVKGYSKKYNLILTSGSDFHGKNLVKLMPGDHNLGKNNCDEKIVKRLEKLSKVL